MRVLYEDDRVFVCIKPAGVLSTDEPGGMPERIRAYLGEEKAVVKTVHRLDRVVGGVMVFARAARAASDLSAQIRNGSFYKEYRAVIPGVPAEREGSLLDYLIRNKAERKTYIADASHSEAQEARLDYAVLKKAGGISLVKVVLHTGRTHQIRCQFAGRGLPLLGDRKYGGAGECETALWSYCVAFNHPRTGERMTFSVEPPADCPWDSFRRKECWM